jgi:hypothetical protein
MEFNEQKFEVLRYGKIDTLISNTSYQTASGVKIETKKNVKDLGVWMQNDASFDEQIARAESSGRRWCSWVLRTFETRQRDIMLTLWKQLILPRIEYCSPLWAPYKRKDLEKIEGIQRTFTSKIAGLTNLRYHDRLKELNMYSIQRRFERFIIICVWKIIEEKTVNVNNQIRTTFNSRSGRKCVVPLPKLNGGLAMQTKLYNSFAVRGPRLFNRMPPEIRNISNSSTLRFKRMLDKYLQRIPDTPVITGYPHTGDNSLIELLGDIISRPLHSDESSASQDDSLEISPAGRQEALPANP